MKAVAWLGLMILIFTPAPLVYAQTGVQLGPIQQPGTSTTDSVKKTKEVGPQGQVSEKEVKTTSSKRDHADYKYSGLPWKWTGGVSNTGPNADLVKDTGPKVRYTVDRLPAGANPEEALWVKMRDGRMMMVDPKLVQNLH
ncbi:MAG: hypothetical protein KKD99_01935 [Proteobacteria bacterium]|nr:hypothetical protein [Pseudomonadota bacterium]MBU4354947.1 hypothetical protein [Pseudomonadota bacterium]MBU4447318.1 hypothetical protein [Pseudomonadota bacterium]MCG2773671.1 hypothetical protein [Desulfobacterales bacterium]